MFNLNNIRLKISIMLLFFPLASQADAINPLMNLFTKETAPSAAAITIFIILIESTLLRKYVKSVPLRTHVWRTTISNIFSSAAGSIAALFFLKEQLSWRISELYVPMFLLTLIIETPAIRFLYNRDNFTWLRSIKFSVLINMVSYILLFIVQLSIFSIYLFYANFSDEQSIKKWTDVSLLNGESGYIYTIKNVPTGWPQKYAFNRYDVENKKWEIIDPGCKKGLDYLEWDIRGNIIACTEKKDTQVSPTISILDINNFSKISEIKSKGGDMRISPDLRKIAVLEFDRYINAPRDNESHFMLGAANKLRIYDIKSGNLLFESPRPALDEGLTWLNNSNEVIFSSLRDNTLFHKNETYNNSIGYGRLAYSKQSQFPIDLFMYNLETNSVSYLTEGAQPHTINLTNEITYIKEIGLYKYQIWKSDAKLRSPQFVMEVANSSFTPSLTGKKYLIKVPHQQPLGGNSFLTVVETDDKDKKFIIESVYRYLFRWVEK